MLCSWALWDMLCFLCACVKNSLWTSLSLNTGNICVVLTKAFASVQCHVRFWATEWNLGPTEVGRNSAFVFQQGCYLPRSYYVQLLNCPKLHYLYGIKVILLWRVECMWSCLCHCSPYFEHSKEIKLVVKCIAEVEPQSAKPMLFSCFNSKICFYQC